MIKIRKNAFETNSSSTHCLCLVQSNAAPVHDELFLREYVVKPWNPEDVPYSSVEMENNGPWSIKLTALEDKLAYFLTMFFQSYSWGDCGSVGESFMKRLQTIFPNALFVVDFARPQKYILEDGDYLFDSEDYNASKLAKLSDEELKAFMEYGVIYFGDRNFEPYYDFLHYDIPKEDILIRISG